MVGSASIVRTSFGKSSMSISETTRRNIIDFLRVENLVWHGRLDPINFLERVFDLSKLPSTDRRYPNADGDIWQHTVNNDDWESNWVYDYPPFDLLRSSEEVFLNFLCEMLHPIVRSDSTEVAHFVKLFNDFLRSEGWEIVETMRLGGVRSQIKCRCSQIDAFWPKSLKLLLSEHYSYFISNKNFGLLSQIICRII